MTGYALSSASPYTSAESIGLPVYPAPLESAAFTAWWDAKRLSVADGDPVSTWTDELSGISVVQATSSRQPTLQRTASGKPFVRFDGVDDTLIGNLAWESFPFTVFTVARFMAASPSGVQAVIGNEKATDSDLRIVGATPAASTRAHSNGTSLDVAGTLDNDWHVRYAVFDGASSVAGFDGTELAGTLPANTTPSNKIRFALWGNAHYTQVDIAMVALAPAALDSTARAAEVANLKRIHGIA